MQDLAIKKIQEELKSLKGSMPVEIMKKQVADKLLSFCRQDEEFAQAVYQGGSFADCMKKVAEGASRENPGIEDLQAYQRAVQFFFPGAGIEMTMKINLCASVEESEEERPAAVMPKKSSMLLDLKDFM